MKRFRSPIQKVQRIQQQQLRMAELHLAQAQASIRKVEGQIQSLREQSVQIEGEIVQQFSKFNRGLAPSSVKAARAHLEQCRADIRNQIEYRNQLESDVAKVRAAYRKLKSRCDGVDELLMKKQSEHRRLGMLHEQTELEESARTLRLLNDPSGDGNSELNNRREVEDGVIQR